MLPSFISRHTWIGGNELHGAALDRGRIARRAKRIRLVSVLHGDYAVVPWVRVNEYCNSAPFLSSLNLNYMLVTQLCDSHKHETPLEATEQSTIPC